MRLLFVFLVLTPCLLFSQTKPHVSQIEDAMWYDGTGASTTVTLNNLVIEGNLELDGSISLPDIISVDNLSVASIATITYLNAITFVVDGEDVLSEIDDALEILLGE
jgi:hypothetical protein